MDDDCLVQWMPKNCKGSFEQRSLNTTPRCATSSSRLAGGMFNTCQESTVQKEKHVSYKARVCTFGLIACGNGGRNYGLIRTHSLTDFQKPKGDGFQNPDSPPKCTCMYAIIVSTRMPCTGPLFQKGPVVFQLCSQVHPVLEGCGCLPHLPNI